MKEQRNSYYEGMFLLSSAQAADLGGAVAHIQEIIRRGHGEIIAMRKWDERRLAFEIKGQKRGVYILVYFKSPNEQLSHIERDCRLSEKLLRTMILKCETMSVEEMQAADARKELEVEAKLRAERVVAGPEGAAAAPAAPAAPAAEAPAEA